MPLVPFGFCQNCQKKMKIIYPETTPSVISKMRVCINPNCLKHDTYRTYEIHEARYLLLLDTERKAGGPVPEHPITYTLPDRIFEPQPPLVEVEHSYKRDLTPVEPAPTTPNWKFPDWGDYANRENPDQRKHYVAAATAWNAEYPHLARLLAPWVEQPAQSSAEAENPLAKEEAQNKAYYALKAKLDQQFKDGEINTDEYDAAMRELTDGG